MSGGRTIHASCVVVGESGVLIRGASGSGKSTLARRLIETAQRRGRFARLVGDDRIVVEAQGGRLVARGHAALSGAIEVRGVGLVEASCERAALIRLVVDCAGDQAPRWPAPDERSVTVEGVRIDRIFAQSSRAEDVLLALETSPSALEAEPALA